MLNRFTGLLDEEWFMKTHVIIESEVCLHVKKYTYICIYIYVYI